MTNESERNARYRQPNHTVKKKNNILEWINVLGVISLLLMFKPAVYLTTVLIKKRLEEERREREEDES